MTEYWKSLPRKFCTYCKCWITDNKSSVEFHERGKNHLENVKKKLDELRKKGLKDAREKESADSVLKAMEEAALKSARDDLKRDPSLAALYGATIVAKASDAAAAGAAQLMPTQTTRAHSQAAAAAAGPGKTVSAKTNGNERCRPASAAAVGRSDAGPVCIPRGGVSDSPGAAVGDSDEAGGGGDGVEEADAGSAVVDDAHPSAVEWQRALSPEGYEYYWNVRTGESSWTLPEGAAAAAAETHDGKVSEEAPAEGDEQQQRRSSGGASLAEHTSPAAAEADSAVDRCSLAAATSAACSPAATVLTGGAADDGETVKVKAEPSNSEGTVAICVKLETVVEEVVKDEPSRAPSRAKAAIAAAAERLKAEAQAAAGTVVKSEADAATAARQIKAEPGDDGCTPVAKATCDVAAAAALATAAAKGGSSGVSAERTGTGSSHKRPAISFSPYGRWVTVEAEKPPPVVDLQLPTNAKNYDVPVVDIPLPERVDTLEHAKDVQPQFKEKVVTLQGKVTGEVAFKKRKVGGAKQNARRRDGEDD